MRYLPTLNVWEPSIQTAIQSGQLKLQRGQWLRCGNSARPSRYIGMIGRGDLWLNHWQGSPKNTRLAFEQKTEAMRMREGKA